MSFALHQALLLFHWPRFVQAELLPLNTEDFPHGDESVHRQNEPMPSPAERRLKSAESHEMPAEVLPNSTELCPNLVEALPNSVEGRFISYELLPRPGSGLGFGVGVSWRKLPACVLHGENNGKQDAYPTF